MHRKARIVPRVVLLACFLLLGGATTTAVAQKRTASPKPAATAESAENEQPAANEESAADEEAVGAEESVAGKESAGSEESAETTESVEAQPAPEPELSPQMVALRDAVRAGLARLASHPFNSRDNTPAQVMELCLAFGCDATLGYGGSSGKRVNAVGCLSWNYPCAGYRLLRESEGHVMGRVGYGLQARPSQFLAVLAQARVPSNYEIRVDEFRGAVADLVEFEKLSCRSGTDLSQTLIGLTHYLDDQSWKNDLQEEWSLERLVREESSRSVGNSSPDVTGRLMGLSYAVDRQKQRGQPLEGVFLEAEEHLSQFHDYALDVQNSDGTWHPSFFAYKGTSRDASASLRSTGHILEWLVFSLPPERLEEPRVVRSVAYVAKLLGNRRSRWNVTSMSDQDFVSLMRAAHALSIYDRRLFQPPAEEEPAAEEDESLAYRTTPE